MDYKVTFSKNTCWNQEEKVCTYGKWFQYIQDSWAFREEFNLISREFWRIVFFLIFSSKKLSAKELVLLNCGIGEDFWESLGLQGDPISQS